MHYVALLLELRVQWFSGRGHPNVFSPGGKAGPLSRSLPPEARLHWGVDCRSGSYPSRALKTFLYPSMNQFRAQIDLRTLRDIGHSLDWSIS